MAAWRASLLTACWLMGVGCLAFVTAAADAQESAPALETYGQVRDMLAKHTKVIELTDANGVRVAICPEYQGRVMTSTCGGLDGLSFGWVNRAFIESGEPSAAFNNYGGEDRFWLGPEAGQFGLWFAPGEEQVFANWKTPPALNEGAFDVTRTDNVAVSSLTRRMKLTNASKTAFDLEISRDVQLLGIKEFGEAIGSEAAAAAEGLKMVGFQTSNSVYNRGETWSQETGLLSIWTLGMFQPSPQTVIVVPYRPGSEAKLGPVVFSDYFGKLPPERLKVTPSAILFLGDGQFRSKIGTSQRRAKNMAGSIDFQRGVLTLVLFTMPSDPSDKLYVNNQWKLPQKAPFVGDVFNSYNDGPTAPGEKSLGSFYELETLSSTVELQNEASIHHVHRTFHFQGEISALAKLAKAALGVELEDVRQQMFGK